jgi:hypothetical protein
MAKDYLNDISLSEREASGIARVLRLCDVIVRGEIGEDVPPAYDPQEVLELLDEVDNYFDLLCGKLEDRGTAPPV